LYPWRILAFPLPAVYRNVFNPRIWLGVGSTVAFNEILYKKAWLFKNIEYPAVKYMYSLK